MRLSLCHSAIVPRCTEIVDRKEGQLRGPNIAGWLNETMPLTTGAERRVHLKQDYWPKEFAWNGAGVGWFKGPRTLPLILAFLADKKLTAGRDVSRVYLELLARHMDGGVVEVGNEADHAYAAGYTGTRAIRTWTERMQLLEKLGFIKSKHIGNQRYKLVLLVDPLVAVANLRKQGSVPADWLEVYLLRIMETKEADARRLEEVGLGRKRKKEAA